MVVTEAIARGLPVLTTEVDALPETDGRAGLFVPADDVPALTAALRRWRTEPELRDGLRAAARDRELEDWTTAARRFLSSRRRHTRYWRDWSSDVCSSDLRDFLLRARLDAASLEAWIEAGWLAPQRAGPERVFSELDLARAWLIRDMRDGMGVNDEEIGRASGRERV